MKQEEHYKSLEEAAEELAKNAYPDKHNLVWMFKRGAEWQKEQMLKSAKDGYVSGIIIHNDGNEEHYAVTYPNGERLHSIMDKVRIIIVKEEN